MSAPSLEKVLAGLQETLWPGGERRVPAEPRTEAEKDATRVDAGKKLGLLIPGECPLTSKNRPTTDRNTDRHCCQYDWTG
jgi:hypothetical protein